MTDPGIAATLPERCLDLMPLPNNVIKPDDDLVSNAANPTSPRTVVTSMPTPSTGAGVPLVLTARREPWFEDGNIILITEDNSAFRVHRGVLARQSEIFHDMVSMPQTQQASRDSEKVEGCDVVRMYDLPHELSGLLKAIYDGVTFQTCSIDDFFSLSGLLRLSTKYFMKNLRSQALKHLAQTWTYTLKGHDTMVELALTSPAVDHITYPYAHPLQVLHLARDTNIRIVIPSALYFLSLYPFSELKKLGHPKLTIAHPSNAPHHLSYDDIQHYTLMFQHRLDLILDFTRRFCGERRAGTQCRTQPLCTQAFHSLGSRMSRLWYARTGPLHWMLQSVKLLDTNSTACTICKRDFRDDVDAHRMAIWKGLPGVVGLPEWEVLIGDDLPP